MLESNILNVDEIKTVNIVDVDIISDKFLGSGSSAYVYLGLYLNQTKVAIKIIKYFEDEEDREKKYNLGLGESFILTKLGDNKYICSLIGAIMLRDQLCLVQPFAFYGDVISYVGKKGRLNEILLKRMFKHLLKAMSYIHKMGIVHRDIKPDNLLITKDENNPKKIRLMLTDFGLSTMWSNDTMLTSWVGSFPYVAPELLKRIPYKGPEIDIWSSGMTLLAISRSKEPYLPISYNPETKRYRFKKTMIIEQVECLDPLQDILKKFLYRILEGRGDKRPSTDDLLKDKWILNKCPELPVKISSPLFEIRGGTKLKRRLSIV